MMKLIDSTERLKILISLGDQLWEDLNNFIISEKEYSSSIDYIRKELNKEASLTFSDLQNIAAQIGYVLVKKQNIVTKLSDCNILKN
ncbi:hypothetical protein [Chryseobacterium proteolyticum]|uniref:hypothetical protein n=1 Tax=Chryseobacterium proteolyticum TaxID=118127 RepID=UPI003983C669